MRSVPATSGPLISLIPTDDPGRWADACRRSGQTVTPFHTYEWLSQAARMTATEFTPIIVRAGDEDVGVVPWLSRRRGPLAVVNWLPFPYVGPLVPQSLIGSCLTVLRGHALRKRAAVTQLSFPPRTEFSAEDITARGFELHFDETYIIDTSQDEEELWAGLHKKCRRNTRRAESLGVTIHQSGQAAKVLARVVDAAFARTRGKSGYVGDFPPMSSTFTDGALAVHWTVATYQGIDVGTLVTLLHHDYATCWMGGVLPEYRSSQANMLLHWDAIRWARRSGASSLDLVGVPNERIRNIKRQYGGSLYTYPVLQRMAPGWRQVRTVAGKLGIQ
ncbi:GNAT family N-acetyltransferase [Streptacidiphilus sp. MAP12-20]|uniref:GNAT family N-acetyltransferase n=1 Tax=Streptacidiphilus sp. MAP12-20 TaxID=3156299 RepID=UPI00351870B0